jgi:hypothetical protein
VPQYADFQHFSKLLDSLTGGTLQGNVICGLIRTLEANCTTILNYSRDDRATVAENTCSEMVRGAVRALREFCLFVRQQNHFYLSLKVLDDALDQFMQKKGIHQEQKMSKSSKVKVDNLLARVTHQ